MSWPWSELGLEGPAGLEEVKHAYAQRLKTTHPEEDPEGFQRLHSAYLEARRRARSPQAVPEETVPEEEAAPEAPPEEDEGFDYERLFAEAAEERREALRQRAGERLRAAREHRGPDAVLDGEEAREAARTALMALEVLYSAGARMEEWTMFLHSSTFLDAQNNADFIWGLEDFLREHPVLPHELRRRIFLAYGFYRRKPLALHRSLYRLLLPSYQRSPQYRRERLRLARREPLLGLGALLLVFLISFMNIYYGSVRSYGGGHSAHSSPSTGAADTSSANKGTGERITFTAPDSHDREGEIDNEVPLGDGNRTSFHGMVTSYAAADFPGLYAVCGRGTAENGDETFQWIQCKGQDAQMEELVMNYYLSADKKSFYCVPEGAGGEEVEMVCTRTFRDIKIFRCAEG